MAVDEPVSLHPGRQQVLGALQCLTRRRTAAALGWGWQEERLRREQSSSPAVSAGRSAESVGFLFK